MPDLVVVDFRAAMIERDHALADLARVTAERDRAREDLRLADLDVETLQATVARMVTQATEMQAALDQRTAERDSLIERRHEVQRAADARYSEALRELRDWNRWKEVRQQANELLTEPGIIYQSAYVQAVVTDLMAERDAMRKWAAEESEHWEGRNADRFWQMQRVLARFDAAQQESA